MSAELEKLAEEYKQRGFVGEADSLLVQARIFKKGGMPEHFGDNGATEVARPTVETLKVYPEISLREEMDRQAKIAAHDFAKEFGVSEQAYIATLPEIFLQPQEYRGLLDMPLRVEPRVDWQRKAKLCGIGVSDYLKQMSDQVKRWGKDNKFEVPDKPYIAWASGESRFVNRKPSAVRQGLQPGWHGGIIIEGIDYHNAYPESVRRIGLDLIGEGVGSGNVPYLGFWNGRPGLGAGWDDDADPNFRTLVLGSKIGT